MSAVPMKKVTFTVPAHIADLIEETRDLVDQKWDRWGTNPFLQSFEDSHGDFERSVDDFCSLMFYDGKVSAKRLRKLLPHLKKAFDCELALSKGAAS